MLVGLHKGFILLINGYDIFYICYANYKSNIYLDERFMLRIYDCDTFCIPYKKYKNRRTLYKVFMLHLYVYDTFYDKTLLKHYYNKERSKPEAQSCVNYF